MYTEFKTSKTQIDWLRFTANIKDFADLQASKHPFIKGCFRAEQQTLIKDFDHLGDYFSSPSMADLIEYVRRFGAYVLGFQVSEFLNGAGRLGYFAGAKLTTLDGLQCGEIWLGGNADTVCFELTGTACKYIFDMDRRAALGDDAILTHSVLVETLKCINAKIKRLDICFDDLEGGVTCEGARMAWARGDFRRVRGTYPKCQDVTGYAMIKGQRVVTGDTFYVGSRSSKVFHRVYNKALEQGAPDMHWIRVETELKDVAIETIRNLDACFFALTPYHNSLTNHAPKPYLLEFYKKIKEAVCIKKSMTWLRNMTKKTYARVLELAGGDVMKANDFLYGAGVEVDEVKNARLGFTAANFDELCNLV